MRSARRANLRGFRGKVSSALGGPAVAGDLPLWPSWASKIRGHAQRVLAALVEAANIEEAVKFFRDNLGTLSGRREAQDCRRFLAVKMSCESCSAGRRIPPRMRVRRRSPNAWSCCGSSRMR
jgi:hypothetical protein